MSPPGGGFLVVELDGNVVGCGGLKRLDDETARSSACTSRRRPAGGA